VAELYLVRPHTMPQSLFDAFAEDDDFLRELGRLLITASQFEANLRQYAIEHSEKAPYKKATLGPLLKHIRSSTHFAPTLDEHITFAIEQRNYFVHNLSHRLSCYTTDDFTLKQFMNRLRGLSSDLTFFSRLFAQQSA
jgi:hypothetical protein